MRRGSFCLAAALGNVSLLGACNTPPPPAVQVLCQQDAALQPIAVTAAPAIDPKLAGAARIDALLVHPLVVAACASLLAKPVAVVPVP